MVLLATPASFSNPADTGLYIKVGHPSFPFERAWLDKLLAEREDLVVVDASEGIRRREGFGPRTIHLAEILATEAPA